MARLSSGERKSLPNNAFAIPSQAPGSGSYPINDKTHARDALSRVSANGSPAQKAEVRAAVARKFPGIKQGAVDRPTTGKSSSMGGGVERPVGQQIRKSPGRDMGHGSMGDWADSHHPVGRR